MGKCGNGTWKEFASTRATEYAGKITWAVTANITCSGQPFHWKWRQSQSSLELNGKSDRTITADILNSPHPLVFTIYNDPGHNKEKGFSESRRGFRYQEEKFLFIGYFEYFSVFC